MYKRQAIKGLAQVPDLADGTGKFLVFAIIVSVGMSLGGLTGYAINPARDLGPRLAHAVLPIQGKGSSDFGYGLVVPIVGPIPVSYTHLDVYKSQLIYYLHNFICSICQNTFRHIKPIHS